jgi:hypothetical protein
MNAKSHRVLAGMLTVMLISVCTLLVAEQVSGTTARTASGTLRQSSTSSSIGCATANWLFDTAGGVQQCPSAGERGERGDHAW